ncbi:MAG: hypothetical protein IJZ37_05600 [Clostridia bacterium]|nr:hypothetical protein [Clostridia bacterium]
MTHFQKQFTFSILSFLLIFALCGFLSVFHQNKINALLDLCGNLPPTLGKNPAELSESVRIIEVKLKKAGTSLAFFMHYEHLNEAFFAAAALRTSVETGDELTYPQAVVRLREALETLLRLEKPSLELFI